AVRMLLDTPSLDVGAHLAIVGEDPPLLTAREIPTLVDKKGAFPLSYRTVVLRGVLGRIDPDDVRREFGAQLQRIVAAGVPVSHLDTHQHTHLWPSVGKALLELAVANDIRAVRTPHSGTPLPVGFGINLLAARLRNTVAHAGLTTTDGYTGLDEAGAFDQARFERSLGTFGSAADNLGPAAAEINPAEINPTDLDTADLDTAEINTAEVNRTEINTASKTNVSKTTVSKTTVSKTTGRMGSVEINAHPGEAGDPDLGRFDWGYRWPDELAMLLAPASRELVQRHGFRLGTFKDLVAAGGSA
ncbi:MAG: ChbG/HpnK family deacetylase, partial [Nakamurella sp.]